MARIEISEPKKFDTFFEKAFWGLVAVICSAGVSLGGIFGRQFARLTDSVVELNRTMAAFSEQIKAQKQSDELQNKRLDRAEDDIRDLQRNRASKAH